MSKYNVGGGYLGFQDGRHAKGIELFCSIAPSTGQDRHTYKWLHLHSFLGSRKIWVDS